MECPPTRGAVDRADLSRAKRSAATATAHRDRGVARGGVLGQRRGDAPDLRPGGESVSSQQPPMSGEGAGPAGARGRDQPSEEELRAAYQAELERITTAEVIMQTAVSLLNLGARRLRPPEGRSDAAEQDAAAAQSAVGGSPGAGGRRDLEQVRDAIDG